MSNLARLPYRVAAIVEPDRFDLLKYDWSHCPGCEAAFKNSGGAPLDHVFSERFCTGVKRRWWHNRGCDETRAHMHFECKRCNAKRITAPKNPEAFR